MESQDKRLVGKRFCFTGTFSRPRKEMQQLVVENGGKAVTTVGKDTILVWDGIMEGTKLTKAQENGNIIISEEDLYEEYEVDRIKGEV